MKTVTLFLNRHTSLFLLILVGLLATGVVVALETPIEYLPDQVTLGGRAGDDPAEFIADVLMPVLTADSGLVFINPRVNVSDGDEEEFNLGIGSRQLVRDGNAIFGMNAYWDSRWTERDNRFDQVGFGLEWLTRTFDARGNVYLAIDDEKRYDSYETRTLVSRSTRSASWGDPYARNHRVIQSRRRTTTTTTRHEQFGLYEVPLEGYDLEVGAWIPLHENCPAELGLFVGYYNFDEDFGGGDIDGVKGRLELRALPGLMIDAEIYGDDDLNDTDYFVGGRIQIPLDIAGIVAGRNPFAATGANLAMEKRPFGQRLVENVIRDPHIQVTEDLRRDSEELVATATSSSETYVLLDDVQFAYNGPPIDSGDGSAEGPKKTIQEAVDTAYGEQNVYVFATGRNYEENVVLSEGVTLFGQGCPIVGLEGRVFGGDAHPTVDGGSMGPSITVADNTTVRGMHVINTERNGPAQIVTFNGELFDVRRAGIFGHNANNVTITCNNLIEANEHGVLLLADSVPDFRATLRGNTIRENAANGLNIQATGMSGTFTLLSENNDYSNNRGDGVAIAARNFDLATLSFTGDSASDNDGDGMDFSGSDGNDRLVVSLTDVTADNNGSLPMMPDYNGFPVDNLVALDDELPIRNGFLLPGHGINMSRVTVGSGGLDITVTGGSYSGNAGSGIEIAVDGDGPVVANFTGVTANDNGANGIALLAGFQPIVFAAAVAAEATELNGTYPTGVGSLTASFTDVTANRNGLGLFKLPPITDDLEVEALGPVVSAFPIGIGLTGNGILVMGSSGLVPQTLVSGGSGDFQIYGSGNVVMDNGFSGIYLQPGPFWTDALIDFGGGALGSPGLNTISGNAGPGFWNGSPVQALAQFNFWGNVPPIAGIDYSPGNVDVSNHLTTDPNL